MNVLFVTIDCWRYDTVGYSQAGRGLTPQLDRFAENATLFTQAIAPGAVTRFSFASIFSGAYPYMHRNEAVWGMKAVPDTISYPTMAMYLQKAGFAVGGFHSNPWLSAHFGHGGGYDVYEDNLLPPWLPTRSKLAMQLHRGLHFLAKPYTSADKIVPQAWRWIQQQQQPFFAWVHLMDAHGPYRTFDGVLPFVNYRRDWQLYNKAQSSPESITAVAHQQLVQGYERGVRLADKMIGQLLDQLAAAGKLADTLVIVTADHGETFAEHGRYTHFGSYFYDEVLRVPLLIRTPAHNGGSVRVTGQTSLINLAPTILVAAGLPQPEQMVGQSLWPWLTGEMASHTASTPQAIAAGGVQEKFATVAVRTEAWKYMMQWQRQAGTLTESLYHLADDPDEMAACQASEPEMTAQLRTVAQDHVNGMLASAPEETVVSSDSGIADDLLSEQLRKLGYLNEQQ